MAYVELDVLNNTPYPVLGIDLGTTNSLVAVWWEGRPMVLRPGGEEGNDPRIASAIHIQPDGMALVGCSARDKAMTDPAATLFSVKRLMGRGLADVQSDLESMPFSAEEDDAGLIRVQIGGKRLTPQELSALILKRARQVAIEHLGADDPDALRRAVITVPAYFDDAQRQATRDAARLAGLEVLRVINEPTAASLAYGLDRKDEGIVAVYDLGGGTFDVSILAIEGGVFRVLATSGDTHLGGDDLDRALVALAITELRGQVDEALLQDPAFLQGLRLGAERCKVELSLGAEAEFQVVVPDAGLHWRHIVTRETFEQLIEPLIERTLDACRRALADAKLSPDAIDEVVLVGGSTRIPMVRAAVKRLFGRDPHCELDPDQVVALGAAVQGHVLAGGTREILLLDVTPLSLGLETMGGATSKIIARNSPIPCQTTEGFTTYADDQTGIDLNIVQGEREMAAECRSLGRFKLTGIPPMPAGMARVSVRFQIDADGILTVSAVEDTSGAKASVEVRPMHGLSDTEVETMLEEAYSNAHADFEQRRVADLKAELGTMIRVTERHHVDAEEGLDRESLLELTSALEGAREVEQSEDLAAIEGARDALEQASLPLAAILMDAVARESLAGKKLGDL